MEDEHLRAIQARKGSPFLTDAQTALYLGLTRQTLQRMRTRGDGPRFRKHGRFVRYHIEDLDSWSMSVASEKTRK
ncbi:helix-turn-helix domain-containing protein [Sphingomonas sp. JC676]|uniref:helix-turn-helix domain-containing protein n=1 Tax=Sphingomonas sp. JC676 TaxID=2768065 RepID=UPI00165842C9|nr:helix-turn-helix domain-containing protein [Sphingomonas sp. JC676]MBC9030772.1 helix-turn-helix domain-containing protein [Sphingomonas sp. JC676]